ncbi:MAG: outer membrane beta-barrel protein [Bacteroidota bacterium]
MEENIPQDPLSDLFRKKLRDEELERTEPSTDQWDLPSDGVWEGLGPHLPPAPPSSPALYALWKPLTWAAVLVVTAGVGYFIYSYQQQLASLTEQVEALRAQGQASASPNVTTEQEPTTAPLPPSLPPKNPASTEPTEREGAPETSALLDEREQAARENDPDVPFPPSLRLAPGEEPPKPGSLAGPSSERTALASSPTNDQSTAERSTAEAKPPAPSADHPVETMANLTSDPAENKYPVEEGAPEKDQQDSVAGTVGALGQAETGPRTNVVSPSDLAVLPRLPLEALVLVVGPVEVRPIRTSGGESTIIPRLRPGGRGFYVGLLLAPTSGFVRIKGQPRNPRDFARDKTSVSGMWGGEVGYHWNRRWSVALGGQYAKLNLRSRHLVSLRYSRQLERPGPNQRFESDYRVPIPTAYGEVSSEISLYRESATPIADASDVPLGLQTNQQLVLLHLPLMVQYRLTDRALRLTAQGGVAANLLLDNSTEVLATTINRRGLVHQRSRVIEQHRNLRSVSWDYLLGLGLEWQVAPQWQLSVEPVFSQSLTPIFANERWKSTLVKSALTLGIQYQI